MSSSNINVLYAPLLRAFAAVARCAVWAVLIRMLLRGLIHSCIIFLSVRLELFHSRAFSLDLHRLFSSDKIKK